MNGTNDTFTIAEAGRYRISYHVNITLALALGTRIVINGAPVVQSTITPVLTLSNFSNEILIDIAANDTVSLELFGLAGAVVLLGGSAGASLMIIRLS